jgi:hypothetical protein
MKKVFALSLFSCVAFLLIALNVARGQAPVPMPAPAQPAAAAMPQGPRDGLPPFEEVTRDMKRADGLFSLFYYEPAERSRDPERLLALIPRSLLNQDILFATSISEGGSLTGHMWDDYLIRWEIRGRSLALVLPEVRYAQPRENPVAEVIGKTYNSRILATAPIVTFSGGGEPLVDLGPLLKSNIAGLPSGGMVRSDLSRWMKKKLFPDNVLIGVELALASGQGASLTGVTYAFRRLPDLGSYQPRAADDRVGYFVTARRDWTKKHDSRELFDRFVNRWNLQKKDPSLELSPPVQPITFIIEKTVPVQWRRWIRQGIEAWNKAYEKIGFTDAIQVLQQTADNDLKDIDPEDARYNFFRWIVSGTPFAMGPSRVDPRTGQILDADIIFDDSMVRAWMEEFDLFTTRTIAQAKGPGFRRHIAGRPDFRVPGDDALSVDPALDDPAMDDAARKTLEEKFASRGQQFCDFAAGLQHQIALGYFFMAVAAKSPKIPERLIGESIRETVTHEIGHTLGLRHNFKASSWLSIEEIRKRRQTDEPTSASIMDYNPILFFGDDGPETAGHFVTPTIGPYDYWAIEYGYKVRGPGDPGEEEMLAAIAKRSSDPTLAYATDEETEWVYSPDPLVGRFDLSSDPGKWAVERVKLADRLLSQIGEVAAAPGESQYFLRQAFETLMMEKGTSLSLVARWIGGQHFSRAHRGDPNAPAPFVLVPAAKQREALAVLKDTIFRDGFFAVSPDLLNRLPPPRWRHWGMSLAVRLDYPIHERIRMLQWYVLSDVLAPPVLQRIYDAELKSPASDRFTVAELVAGVRDAIWAKVGEPVPEGCADASPFISSTARGLQREHLDAILETVLMPSGVSPDIASIVCGSGRELSARIGVTLKDAAKLDGASRAHLVESKSRLDRALEAQYQVR